MHPSSQQQQNLPGGVSTNPDDWDWSTPTSANQAPTSGKPFGAEEGGSFRAGSLFGAVTEPSFGTGPSYGPGAVSGTSFGSGPVAGTSFGPGTVAWPSFGPGAVAPPSFRPGAVAGTSFGPGTVAWPSFGPGAVAPPSFRPGAVAGTSFGPGTVAWPSFGPGAVVPPSFRPGAVVPPSFRPGAVARTSFGPGAVAEPSFGIQTGASFGPQATFETGAFQPTGYLGKRSFTPTMESEIERPAPKVQTLGPEDVDKLDEWGFFVDEPIPEEMEMDEIPPNTNQAGNIAGGATRNVPLVPRRRMNSQQQQQSGPQFGGTQQNKPPQPPN